MKATGKVIGTCGHEFKDIKGNVLIIKEYNREGLRCICSVNVCDGCAVEYEYSNIVIHTQKEESDYLYGENIIETMQDRGYFVSPKTEAHSCYLFSRVVNGILINAVVNIKEKDSTIELSYSELKMHTSIVMDIIAFDHPQFERFEKILLHYAKLCVNNNPFDLGL